MYRISSHEVFSPVFGAAVINIRAKIKIKKKKTHGKTSGVAADKTSTVTKKKVILS